MDVVLRVGIIFLLLALAVAISAATTLLGPKTDSPAWVKAEADQQSKVMEMIKTRVGIT